jgi:HEPN domain-containing protein
VSSFAVAEAKQLFEAGRRDHLACTLLIESRRAAPETIGFLAQQACEKFIKARIVLTGGVVNRTHDLDYLADLAIESGLDVPADRVALRQLNPYAVAFRYEGHQEASLDESLTLTLVEGLLQWCDAALRAAEAG